MWSYIATFLVGMLTGGALALLTYALLIANDDPSNGHPL